MVIKQVCFHAALRVPTSRRNKLRGDGEGVGGGGWGISALTLTRGEAPFSRSMEHFVWALFWDAV